MSFFANLTNIRFVAKILLKLLLTFLVKIGVIYL